MISEFINEPKINLVTLIIFVNGEMEKIRRGHQSFLYVYAGKTDEYKPVARLYGMNTGGIK